MKNKRKLVYQQHLDLQFPLTQQLGLDLDAPVDQRIEFYVDNNLATTIDAVWASGTISSYLTVSNSNGDEAARIDDTGISLRMEKQSWLKTKVANWIGVKYL
jgi:hypothetical protein